MKEVRSCVKFHDEIQYLQTRISSKEYRRRVQILQVAEDFGEANPNELVDIVVDMMINDLQGKNVSIDENKSTSKSKKRGKEEEKRRNI